MCSEKKQDRGGCSGPDVQGALAQINGGHHRKSPVGLSALQERWHSVFRELFSLIQILPFLRLLTDTFPEYVGPNPLCAELMQPKEGFE